MTGDRAEMSPLKRSLQAIERLQAQVRALESRESEPLAVVGMGCRLPGGVRDPESFLELLRAGTDAISELPPVARPTWGGDADDGIPPAGYLDIDLGAFDPGFFGISPREARGMDPQQRLTLECAWEAMEDAGIDPFSLEGSSTGVFVGATGNDYAQVQIASERAIHLLDSHYTSGVAHSMISGRLSYLWGLQGPSLTVDTACSSSLVALHLAARSLQNRESDLAVVGGVNVILSPDYARAFQRSRMLSPDGRCKTFSASADGFSRGEGCAVVLLKRLDDAVRDGDPIRAVLRGSAVNQDGPSSGLTAPNGPAQEAVIRAALKRAGWTPADVDYVEAHGTGTELGDPIEAQALGAAYGTGRSPERPLLVGSVKTNFGHVEAAAGLVGFIKAVLCAQYREVPPSLHFDRPSEHIPWHRLPLRVVADGVVPELRDGRLRAGVSSFGFSGTNAHALVETHVPVDVVVPADVVESSDSLRPHVLALSAPTSTGLAALADAWAVRLATADSAGFADLCHTAALGRARFHQRLAVVAADGASAANKLRSWRDSGSAAGLRASPALEEARVAFLFTGQGSQFPGMGASLEWPAYRKALHECADLLDGRLEAPLLEILDPSSGVSELVHRTDVTQPALFALQHALAAQWRAWGVRPHLVLGHSIGEYAAAVQAGIFALEDALALVVERGRLMHGVERAGRMLAVFADEAQVVTLLDGVQADASIAAINAPGQVVVSGAVDAMDEVEARAAGLGLRTKALHTSHAFHSPLMEPVVEGMRSALAGVSLKAPAGPRFVSSVDTDADDVAEAEYWARQVRQPVRFAAAAAAIAGRADVGVEIGPRATLIGLIKEADLDIVTVPSMTGGDDANEEVLAAVGQLWAHGVEPDWMSLEPGRRVPAPGAPFERTRLWVELGEGGRRQADAASDALLGARLRLPGETRVHQSRVSPEAPAFIGEHVVQGTAVLPGTAYVSAALAAGRSLFGAVELSDIDLLEPMIFDGGARTMHTEVKGGPENAEFTVLSESVGGATEVSSWVRHATGVVRPDRGAGDSIDVQAIRSRCDRAESAEDFYARARERGYEFGARLRGVTDVSVGDGEAIGAIQLPASCADDPERYVVHPLLLDAALQVTGSVVAEVAGDHTWLPVSIGTVRVADSLPATFLAHARAASAEGETLRAQITIVDEEGSWLGALENVVFRQVRSLGPAAPSYFEVAWVESASELVAPTQLHGAVSTTLDEHAGTAEARGYDQVVAELEDRSADWVRAAFDALGWSPEVGSKIDVAAAAESLRVDETKLALLSRCLEILGEVGDLSPAGDGWLVERVADGSVPAGHGVQTAEGRLLDRCGAQLAGALRGDVDPLEVLFSPGEAEGDMEEMYRDAPFARVFGHTLADTIVALARSRDPGSPLRILEVGAGTGGATGHIFRELASADMADRVRYTFTDVSPHFAARARERFADFPSAEYDTYDLDADPADQGFEPGSFDVIVAASCIHASRDLGAALARLDSLLRPGGLLLAVEVLGKHRWFDVTVGLTDSWWHQIDPEVRGPYPCPPPDVWETLLGEAGFLDCHVIPLSSAVDALDGIASNRQGVILARSGAGRGSTLPWLVVTDSERLGSDVVEALEVSGVRGLLASVSDAAATLENETAWAGVVHVHDDRTVASDAASAVGDHLHLARLAMRDEGPAVEALCLVTRGAQISDAYDAEPSAVGAALWGFSRTIGLEAPQLRPARLDLDRTTDEGDARAVARWLAGDRVEPDLVQRRGAERVARLQPVGRNEGDPLPPGYHLTMDERGSLSALHFAPVTRPAPDAGQVRIRVAATGMNFKDVLNVLDLYPGDPGPLGTEVAGVIVEVGADAGFEVGTRVMAITGDAYAEEVIADARLVAPIPNRLSFAEAATVPIAYLTAHFALDHLGRLGPDDRVLIHAATGGVGTAARAIARAAGAQILATAGTEEKRALLRADGVEHVFDSRSASFVEGVQAATGGLGATVVLNSLADDLIGPTFEVTARGARFLEIGKRGIWSQSEVDGLDRDIEYHVIDWGETYRQDPELIARLFRDVVANVGAEEMKPLPSTRFPVQEAEAAFRFMAGGHHIGKVVALHPVLRSRGPIPIEPDATYLLTGGLAGLGLLTAEWLVGQGARSLVLLGRSEPGPAGEAALADLESKGAEVSVVLADLGDAEAVEEALRGVEPKLERLKGIVHSAGSLSDATLARLTPEDIDKVFASKIRGTESMLALAAGRDLDFFVTYSSIAGLFGSPGQANHAAANTGMDATIASVWPSGTGMSIAWGPWAETGSATDPDVLMRTEALGIGALSDDEGIALLERSFADPAPYRVAARIDHPERLEQHRALRLTEGLRDPNRVRVSSEEASDSPTGSSLASRISVAPEGARKSIVTTFVMDRAARILGLPPEREIGLQQPLGELGMDSLLAVELRNVLSEAAGTRLPSTLLFDYPSVSALVDFLLEELGGGTAVEAEQEAQEDPLDALDSLSDEEVERLLSARIDDK